MNLCKPTDVSFYIYPALLSLLCAFTILVNSSQATQSFTGTSKDMPYYIQGSSFLGIQIPDRAFDKSIKADSFWETVTPMPAWLKIAFKKSPKEILGFILWAGEDASRMPKSWIVQGSHDEKVWVDLQSISDQKDWEREDKRIYLLKNPASYKFWRLYFTEGNSHVFRVYEIEPLLNVQRYRCLTIQPEIVADLPITVQNGKFHVQVSSFLNPHGPENAFDSSNEHHSYWESRLGFPLWMKLETQTFESISGFTLWAGETAAHMPKAWTIQASNDDKSWIDLENISEETNWEPGEKRTYTFKKPFFYKYWRLNFMEGNNPIFRIYEIVPILMEPVAD